MTVKVNTVAAISEFIKRFKNLEQSLLNQRVVHDTNRLATFFQEFMPINNRWQQFRQSTAPDYNLFSVLNIRHYETYVHTPFLKHLLNPTETHQQGRLFFDYFLEQILGERFQKENIKYINVYEEYPFSNGRIDILIRFIMNGQPFGLVIENKIYHHDEPKQLERYHSFLTEECQLQPGQYHLVYLKPQQGAPSSYSLNEELYKNLKRINALSEIGYHQHIAVWLNDLVKRIEPQRLKQIILQYIETIKTL